MLRNIWDDPWQDFAALRGELDQVLSRLGTRGNGTASVRPAATFEERDDAIVMEFDLPGVKPEDLEVEVDGRMLTIRGRRRRGQRELIYERALSLPDTLDTETLNADLNQGVLAVSVPKSVKARKRRVEIGTGPGEKAIDVGETADRVEIAA